MRANKHRSAAPIPQRTLPIPHLFNEALSQHAAGRLFEAERGYRKVLAIAPNHADSLAIIVQPPPK
jgi:hypothetical protein